MRSTPWPAPARRRSYVVTGFVAPALASGRQVREDHTRVITSVVLGHARSGNPATWPHCVIGTRVTQTLKMTSPTGRGPDETLRGHRSRGQDMAGLRELPRRGSRFVLPREGSFDARGQGGLSRLRREGAL